MTHLCMWTIKKLLCPSFVTWHCCFSPFMGLGKRQLQRRPGLLTASVFDVHEPFQVLKLFFLTSSLYLKIGIKVRLPRESTKWNTFLALEMLSKIEANCNSPQTWINCQLQQSIFQNSAWSYIVCCLLIDHYVTCRVFRIFRYSLS